MVHVVFSLPAVGTLVGGLFHVVFLGSFICCRLFTRSGGGCVAVVITVLDAAIHRLVRAGGNSMSGILVSPNVAFSSRRLGLRCYSFPLIGCSVLGSVVLSVRPFIRLAHF